MAADDRGARTVIILANCQGWVIAGGLGGFAPDLIGGHKVRMFQNFERLPADYADQCARADIYIFQQDSGAGAQRSDLRIRQHLPAGARILRIPALGFTPLWPSFMQDRNGRFDPRYPKLPFGPLVWKDRFLHGWLRQGLPHAEIIERWLALDMPAATQVDRLLALWTIRQRQREQAGCDVGVTDIVLDSLRERQGFFWPWHPTNFLLMRLADQVLAALGMQPLQPKAYVGRDLLKNFELPIHPGVARHFGLTWLDESHRYLAPWGETVTLRDYLAFYLDYAASAPPCETAPRQATG